MFSMTKDGFVFLVMGFTGKQAAKFKEEYINEFNRMAAMLNAQVQTVPMGYLQKLRDENRAKYALGFSAASEGGKTLSSWKKEKKTLDADLQVIDSIMQPLLTGFEEVRKLG